MNERERELEAFVEELEGVAARGGPDVPERKGDTGIGADDASVPQRIITCVINRAVMPVHLWHHVARHVCAMPKTRRSLPVLSIVSRDLFTFLDIMQVGRK